METDPAARSRFMGVARGEILVILLILIIAAVTRLGRPDLTEFKADEGRLMTLALEMAGGEFAWRGISSSTGFPNAPMSVWLYALPLRLWPHPYAATLFTGLLGVAAVGGTYWLTRRYWGVRAAAVAALMLTVSPWAIIFSRKIWAQDLLPFFAVGWAIGATLAFVEGRKAFLLLHLVCLAIAVQIHPAAFGLVPATLLFLLVFRRRVDWRYVFLGGGLAALTAAPFLWYLFGRRQAEGGLSLSSGGAVRPISLDSLRLIFTISTGEGARSLAGAGHNGLPGETIVRWLWLAWIVCGVIWAIRQLIGRWDIPASKVAFICLVWFFVPALAFVWQWTPVYLHYFIAVMPAPFVLAGAFFSRLLDALPPRGRVAAWAVVIALIAMQLASWVSVMAAVAANPLAGGFGIPLGAKLSAADSARRLLNESGATEVLLAGDGSNPEREDFPAEFRALLHDVRLRYVDLNREAVFPGALSVVLLDTPLAGGPASTRELYERAAEDETLFPVSGTDLAYTTMTLSPNSFPAAGVILQPEPLLANFVRFFGHNKLRLTPEGQLWDVYWRPAGNPDPSDYHLFNHLIDGSGARIAQADGAAFSGDQWRAGDVVISRFMLPLTGEAQPPLTMRVGMYRFPSLENVPVLDEAANPASDAIELPLNP
ncbi:MAG TPA: glycosyltransferase family 39 protein [Promineifilum sp.]|nr:glycosyltransferase family 39 protein [Promineifilum sp.]